GVLQQVDQAPTRLSRRGFMARKQERDNKADNQGIGQGVTVRISGLDQRLQKSLRLAWGPPALSNPRPEHGLTLAPVAIAPEKTRERKIRGQHRIHAGHEVVKQVPEGFGQALPKLGPQKGMRGNMLRQALTTVHDFKGATGPQRREPGLDLLDHDLDIALHVGALEQLEKNGPLLLVVFRSCRDANGLPKHGDEELVGLPHREGMVGLLEEPLMVGWSDQHCRAFGPQTQAKNGA